jgi:CPA1 family monovalent cation:H+ antiporter
LGLNRVLASLNQIGLVLSVAVVVAMVMRRLRLPYTVGLVIAGIVLATTPLTLQLQLSKELIFSVFLPPLVFEAAICIDWHELRKDLVAVTTLATAGVLIAATITAAGMHWVLDWPWSSAIVFGMLISATDPVSVIATFKEAKVHGRLRLLVESESLLNDGTAAIGFLIAVQIAMGAQSDTPIAWALLQTIGGGIICGLTVGFVFMIFAGRTDDHLVELTLTTLTAYASFLIAEHLHCSGVLATLCAGLVTGNYGRIASLSDAGRATLDSYWEYIAFVVNSFIFLLIGAREAQQHFSGMWMVIGVATSLVLLGRAFSIYPLCAIFTKSKLKIDMAHQHILFWGGLRGALALALALGLPESMPYHDEIVTTAFAVVAFSVFIQGLTMTPLLRKLGQLGNPHS